MSNVKRCFEMLFIFILPLIFILLSIDYHVVNTNLIYDDNGNIVEYDKNFNIDFSDSIFKTDSPLYNAIVIVGDSLNLNVSHIAIQLLISYNALMFVMLFLWHCFYGLFDFLVHIFKFNKGD